VAARESKLWRTNIIIGHGIIIQEFLNKFQPIGHDAISKIKLENIRQGEKESIMSFVAELENIHRQLNKYMREDKI